VGYVANPAPTKMGQYLISLIADPNSWDWILVMACVSESMKEISEENQLRFVA